ncbi:MAG: bis(5'-nucleosyl)-tetraphosphatase (symmetrical) [Oceanospirillaceae bacterium]
MATYAIGDVQGCYHELLALLQQCNYQAGDQLWFVGDLVNRGPDSLETLRFIKNLGNSAKIVLGNHDLHLLAIYFAGARLKNSDTLQDILKATDCDDLMWWLKSQPLLHHDTNLNAVMIHAGIPANWSLKQAISRASEVSMALQGNNFVEYFQKMYGNTPNQWHDSLEGIDRLRCITNYLTRMRFCNHDHSLEMNQKGDVGSQSKELLPWFDLHPNNQLQPLILFGHWASLMGKTTRDHIIALDTGCVWGDRMTAICIETRLVYSTPSLLVK